MFGLESLDAGFASAAMIALLAGMVSFVSPCVLPIVPPYLAYMGGTTINSLQKGEANARRQTILAALYFVMGLSTIFLLIGFAASAAGRALHEYQWLLNYIGGSIIILFGLHFLHVFRIGFLDREARIDAKVEGGSAFGAYILGLAFAFGWVPCVGPVLGAIVGLAAQEDSITRGTTLLAIYAIGFGIPFLLVAAYLPRLSGAIRWIKRNHLMIERLMGLLLVFVGIVMVTIGFDEISRWLLDAFPAVGRIG